MQKGQKKKRKNRFGSGECHQDRGVTTGWPGGEEKGKTIIEGSCGGLEPLKNKHRNPWSRRKNDGRKSASEVSANDAKQRPCRMSRLMESVFRLGRKGEKEKPRGKCKLANGGETPGGRRGPEQATGGRRWGGKG